MISLNYKFTKENISGGKPCFLLTEIKYSDDNDDANILISLPTSFSGKLILDNKFFDLKEGLCLINRDKLNSNKLSPRLISEGKSYGLSEFSITEKRIENSGLNNFDKEKIINIILAINEELITTKKEILRIKSQVESKELFTFLTTKEIL